LRALSASRRIARCRSGRRRQKFYSALQRRQSWSGWRHDKEEAVPWRLARQCWLQQTASQSRAPYLVQVKHRWRRGILPLSCSISLSRSARAQWPQSRQIAGKPICAATWVQAVGRRLLTQAIRTRRPLAGRSPALRHQSSTSRPQVTGPACAAATRWLRGYVPSQPVRLGWPPGEPASGFG
jgi:hypothetical protein